MSQLRKALGDAEAGGRDVVESRAPGYLLRTAAVDADRFAELADSTDVEQLTAALALWRGDAYADVADEEFARAECTRLAEQRITVHERLAAARLARGEHDLVAADLAELVARHPLREGLRAAQMRALYAAGRQSEALAAFTDLRERLADELGLDPGPDITALHGRILEQDAELAAPPPAATRSAPPHAAVIRNSLPARLDELVGRAEALAELRTVLPQQRLVTLVGPGGVGKTRLATEAAREQILPDGAHLVELAALPAGEPHVAEHVLAALDVRESAGAGRSATDLLVAALRRRRLLLVLDNCEHVIEHVAALVARLLREAPDLRVLATSREPLGLTGELLWEVPPLAVPADGHDVDAVRRSAAARLFAVRATAQQRAFRLDATTATAVAQLCRRLDGLPLALELAATRVRALGVQGVVDRLDNRFALLTSQQRDLPERQRTLTAVIGWSWDLLEPGDRAVLARLAVFRDGCTPDAAEHVCRTDLDVLARLVDRSLVVMDETATGARYRLLESIAAFALERLPAIEAGGADDVEARHAAYYTALAERADPQLRGPDQQEWLARLDVDAANLRAAGGRGGGLRLALALSWYRFLRGRLSEASRALAVTGDPEQESRATPWRLGFALLQGEPLVPDAVRSAVGIDAASGPVAWFLANAVLDRGDLALATELLPATVDDEWTEAAVLSTRAKLAHATGDLATLESAADRSAKLFTAIGDRWGRLQATDWQGGLAEMRGEHDRAAQLHRDGLRLAEELSLWPAVGSKLSWLAWIAVQTREHTAGRELAERAYALAVEQAAPTAIVFAELSLGLAARREGKLDLATVHLNRLAEQGRSEAQPALYLPMVLVELGHAAEQAGDPTAALALHVEAFEAAETMGSPRDGVNALEGMASAVRSPELAARLLGAAAAARLALEAPAAPAELDEIDRVTERLVTALGRARVAELLAEGGGLTTTAARSLVRATPPAGRTR
ncbi:ATP-binding protein [Pseudonocardia sp. GCM10023141]|uniref:ATP-binding protein n=1 Tax=Pseudonocardia sp. GCM10023141 TaxID=3252653 RepID=UPI00361FBE87